MAMGRVGLCDEEVDGWETILWKTEGWKLRRVGPIEHDDDR